MVSGSSKVVKAAAAMLAALALAPLAGCGSQRRAPVRPRPRTVTLPANPARLTRRPPRALERVTVAHGPALGTVQHVDSRGAALSVSVTSLIDPLEGSRASLPPGTRAVGVEVVIDNAGPDVYDSSATGDFSLVVSAGAVMPVFAPTGTCQTPLRDFDNYITSGEDRSGCVVFAVGARARVLAVRFSPHAAAAGRLTWSASPAGVPASSGSASM
jgi:hypothetical protein